MNEVRSEFIYTLLSLVLLLDLPVLGKTNNCTWIYIFTLFHPYQILDQKEKETSEELLC